MPDSEDYHQMNDTANKAILQELIEGSNDEVISAILGCYQIGASDGLIKKEFSKWKVGPLRQTALYLHIESDGLLKADIITEIITKIESLLMELCGVCSRYYNNHLMDQPVFKCLICKQGCHQPCYEEVYKSFAGLNEKFHKSLHFICSSCQRVYETVENSESDESTNKVKKSPVKSPSLQTDIENVQNKDENVTAKKPTGGPQTPIDDLLEEVPKPKSETVCPDYKWKKCPNYDTCPYKHPPRCRKYLRSGKCPNKQNCNFNHPPLCKYSLQNRKCYNQECRFFHIVGTLRFKPAEEKPPDTNPEQNCQNHAPQPSKQHQINANPSETQIHSTQQLQPNMSPTNAVNNANESNQLSFLVSMINKLREDMRKEIADLKHQQVQSKPSQIPNPIANQIPSPPASGTPPIQQVMLNPYAQALLMNSQLAQRQQ